MHVDKKGTIERRTRSTTPNHLSPSRGGTDSMDRARCITESLFCCQALIRLSNQDWPKLREYHLRWRRNELYHTHNPNGNLQWMGFPKMALPKQDYRLQVSLTRLLSSSPNLRVAAKSLVFHAGLGGQSCFSSVMTTKVTRGSTHPEDR